MFVDEHVYKCVFVLNWTYMIIQWDDHSVGPHCNIVHSVEPALSALWTVSIYIYIYICCSELVLIQCTKEQLYSPKEYRTLIQNKSTFWCKMSPWQRHFVLKCWIVFYSMSHLLLMSVLLHFIFSSAVSRFSLTWPLVWRHPHCDMDGVSLSRFYWKMFRLSVIT